MSTSALLPLAAESAVLCLLEPIPSPGELIGGVVGSSFGLVGSFIGGTVGRMIESRLQG
jgi:hypothetical protein